MSFPPFVNMADLVLYSLSRLQARGGLSTIRLSTIGRKTTWGPVEDTAALKACSRCSLWRPGTLVSWLLSMVNFRRIEDPAQGIMGQWWRLSSFGIGLFEAVRPSSGRAGVSKSGAEGPESCAWWGECLFLFPDSSFGRHGGFRRPGSTRGLGFGPCRVPLLLVTQLSLLTWAVLWPFSLLWTLSLFWLHPDVWNRPTEI